MVTIKKRGQKLSSLAGRVASRLPLLLPIFTFAIVLTACGPAGPRNVIKGEKLLHNGDYQGAISKLEAATQQLAKDPAPVQAQAWNFLGLAYQEGGQPAKAVKAYQQALKLDRNLVEADYNLGVLHLEQKNYSSAIDSLMTYVTLRPRDGDGYTKLGTAYLHEATFTKSSPVEKQRRLDNAKKYFEYARTLQPSAEIDNALGVVLLQRNRPLDAQKEFNAALKRDANYAPAILNLAIIAHQYQRDHRLALERYREYVALKPTPDNASEIETVIKGLEREFAPAPVVAAAPAPKPTPAPAPVVSNAPAPVVATKSVATPAATVPVKNPAPVAAQTPAPKPVASVAVTPPKASEPAPKPVSSTPAPAPATAPLEVAQVSDSATPKVAQDISTPAPQPALPIAAPAHLEALPAKESKPDKKIALLKKLNPMSWFGKKKTKEKPEPAPAIIEETPAPAPAPEAAPVASAPAPSVVTPLPVKETIARYKYTNPTKPAAGNAQAASQFVSQALAARRNGHHEDAVLACRNALLSDPASFDAAYLSGLTAQDGSDFAASLPYFEQALAIRPDSADARYAFAWCLQKAHYPQDAADELEKLLQQTPNDPRANLLLATLYAQNLNQPKLARDHYRKVLEIDPHNSQATAIRFWLAANP